MNFVIYTYGYGDAMFYVLNGIKMIMNTGFFKAMVQGLAAISVIFSAVAYAGQRGMGVAAKPILIRVAAVYLVICIMISPILTVWVNDRVTKTRQNIDKLPFAFVPIALLEHIGDVIAGAVDQAFTPVGNDGTDALMQGKRFNYRDYGLAFGSQLMKEVRNWRISNPEFALNMNNFIRRCVMYDALIGYKYTESELYTSSNAWKLVKDNAGGFTRMVLNIGGKREDLTCHEAAKKIDERYFTSEVELLKKKYLTSDISAAAAGKTTRQGLSGLIKAGDETKAGRIFMSNIEQVHGNFLEAGGAVDIIKQQLMLSALKNFHASSSYGIVRAGMQQESSWAIARSLASEYLPIILTLIKCLMYAGLLFLLPLMVFGGGFARYQNYLLAVASLQLWPSLYVILNMFVEMYSSSSVFGTNGIISYATYSKVGAAADKIAAIAGSLQVFIPLISYQIMQGSIGGIVNMAGNLIGAAGATAGSIASEVVSGNRNLNNLSVDNMQMAQQFGFKTDFNQSYSSGSSYFQLPDGAMETVSLTGDRAYNSANMQDRGELSFNLNSSVEQSLVNSLDNSKANLNNVQVAKRTAEEARFDTAVSFVEKAIEAKQSGKGINFDQAGEEGKHVEEMVNQSIALAKEKGMSTKKIADLVVRGSYGTPKIFGIGADISVGLQIIGEKSTTNSKRHTSEQQEAFKKNMDAITRVAENENILKQNSVDKTISNDVVATSNKVKSIEKTESELQEQVVRYSEALNTHRSKGGSVTIDGNNLVIDRLQAKYNLTAAKAHKIFHNPTNANERRMRDDLINEAVTSHVSALAGDMNTKVAKFNEDYNNNDLNEKYEQDRQKVNKQHNQNALSVTEKADNQGVNADKINQEVDKQDQKLTEQNTDMQNKVNDKVDATEDKLTNELNKKDENFEQPIPKEKTPEEKRQERMKNNQEFMDEMLKHPWRYK